MTKRTPQELADFFDCYATISPSGEVLLYEKEPKYSQRLGSWSSPECDPLFLSRGMIEKGAKNTKNVLFRPHQEPFVFEDARPEFRLGEVFEFDARTLKCTESGILGCAKCFMRRSGGCGLFKCRYYERKDHENVHFEVVGEGSKKTS